MLQYYRDMCSRCFRLLSPLEEEASGPNSISILWKNELEVALLEINRIVSAETLLNYTDWGNMSTVHTDTSDLQLVYITIQNNKPIALFLGTLNKPHCNYNTLDRDIILILGFIKQILVIIFGFKINML